MTDNERIAHWENVREKARLQRRNRVNKLCMDQRAAIIQLNILLDNVLTYALYRNMGGIKTVSAYDLQELEEARETLSFQFNLDE